MAAEIDYNREGWQQGAMSAGRDGREEGMVVGSDCKALHKWCPVNFEHTLGGGVSKRGNHQCGSIKSGDLDN